MKTVFFESIENTQNYALNNYKSEPLLVISYSQESGRGREQKEWRNADQSLAVSLALDNNNKNLKINLIIIYSPLESYCGTKIYNITWTRA